MKLYFSPGACSMAVHIALRESGLKFDIAKVDLAKHTLAGGSSYYDVAPRGYVPLLELDDGSRHTEVASLLQFVADQDPKQALIGAVGSKRRLQVIEWVAFVSSELHKLISPWLWHKESAESTRAAVLDKLATRLKELDTLMGQREYLAGDYSIADAYAFTILNWTHFLQIPITDYPALGRYLTRVSSRPAVQEALGAEGLRK